MSGADRDDISEYIRKAKAQAETYLANVPSTTGKLFLMPNGYHPALDQDERRHLDEISVKLDNPSTIIELTDLRPVEKTRHYIEIKRPAGTLPELQKLVIKWVYVCDRIGFYTSSFERQQYEYYVFQNYTSAMMGDTHTYARILPVQESVGWMQAVATQRRPLVEPNFVIPFHEVLADLKEQMDGCLLSTPQSPLGRMVSQAFGHGGGWATSR